MFLFQNYYDNLPPPCKPAIHIDTSRTESTSDGSAGAPSVGESAISESIPSTPEVQFDNQPPRFSRSDDPKDDAPSPSWPRPRKLSRDSGACELEGPNSCDEQTTVVDENKDNVKLITDLDNHMATVTLDSLDNPGVAMETKQTLESPLLGDPSVSLTTAESTTATTTQRPKLSVKTIDKSNIPADICDNCQTDLNCNPDLSPVLATLPSTTGQPLNNMLPPGEQAHNYSNKAPLWDPTNHPNKFGDSPAPNLCIQTPDGTTNVVLPSGDKAQNFKTVDGLMPNADHVVDEVASS